MKTKELIRQLQEADPTGEAEVTANGDDIYFCEPLPAFYDGPHFVLEHDPARVGRCYSIVGGRINYDGEKVRLNLMGWRDVLLDDPEAPIGVTARKESAWRDTIDACRQEMRGLHARVDRELAEDARRKAEGLPPLKRAHEPPDAADRAEELYARYRGQAHPAWAMLEPKERLRWLVVGARVVELLEGATGAKAGG